MVLHVSYREICKFLVFEKFCTGPVRVRDTCPPLKCTFASYLELSSLVARARVGCPLSCSITLTLQVSDHFFCIPIKEWFLGEYMPFAVEKISRASAWVVLVFLTNLIFYATPFPYCCVQHVILAQNVQSNSSTSHTVANSMQNVQHNKPIQSLVDLKHSYIQKQLQHQNTTQHFNCMEMSTNQPKSAEIHANGSMIPVLPCIVAPTNLSFIRSIQMQQNLIYVLPMVNTYRWNRLGMWFSICRTNTANTSKYCSQMSHTHQHFTRTFFRSAVYGMKTVFKQNSDVVAISNQTVVPNFCWIQIHHHIRFPRIQFLQLKNRSAREITRCGMRNLCMQALQRCNSFQNIFQLSMDMCRASVKHDRIWI